MQEKKLLYGAIIFSLILVSTGFFLTQISGTFPKAANGNITGTVVLKDFYIIDSVNARKNFPANISLPGTTACKVILTSCGNGDRGVSKLFAFSTSGLIKVDSGFGTLDIKDGAADICGAVVYDNIEPGNYLILPSSCSNDTAPNYTTSCLGVAESIVSLIVSYSCT